MYFCSLFLKKYHCSRASQEDREALRIKNVEGRIYGKKNTLTFLRMKLMVLHWKVEGS